MREVRSQIKTYIHEKQNLREGFTETFKPLIETSEAVKTSIDTQQNKLIKQLQDNQLALTAGLEGNRLALTQGFDKMKEVKRSEPVQLSLLRDDEKAEESKTEDEKEYDLFVNENTKFKIPNQDLYYLTGLEEYNNSGWKEIKRKDLEELVKEYAYLIQDDYEIKFIDDPELKIIRVVKTRKKNKNKNHLKE